MRNPLSTTEESELGEIVYNVGVTWLGSGRNRTDTQDLIPHISFKYFYTCWFIWGWCMCVKRSAQDLWKIPPGPSPPGREVVEHVAPLPSRRERLISIL